jgi:hypothetical protein
MSPLQNITIGVVMAAIGVAAFLQVAHVDPVWRMMSIAGVGMVAGIGAMIFFSSALKDR